MNPAGPPRRHRPPRSSLALLVILSAVAGTIATVAVTFAVLAWVRLDHQADQAIAAQRELSAVQRSSYESRRIGALEACVEREDLKADLRAILVAFDVDPAKLPARRGGRGPALAALPGGCEAYVARTVPASSGARSSAGPGP